MRNITSCLWKNRNKCVSQLDDLLAAAKADGDRDFSEAEQLRWDELTAEVKTLDGKIKRADEMYDLQARQPTITEDEFHRRLGGAPPAGGGAPGEPQTWIDCRNGERIMALGAKDKLTNYCQRDAYPSGASSPANLRGSLGRMIRSQILGSWKFAEQEHDLFSASLSTGSNPGGGWIVPDVLSNYVIDLARAKSVCVAAGALTLPLTGSTRIARVLTDASIQCKVELDSFNDSGPTFDSILLDPLTVGAYTVASRELISDAVNGGQIVEDSMVAALGSAIDT